MSVTVQMPALGESVTEGTVTLWLKQEGDAVTKGEGLLEVSTDKVDTEIPSPVAGVLTRIIAGADEVVPVGGDLGVIDEGSGAPTPPPRTAASPAPAPAPAAAPAPAPTPPPAPAAAPAPAPTPPPAEVAAPVPDDGLYVTPVARALAAEHGVDLSTVTGTGPGGRIRRADVVSASGTTWFPAPARLPATKVAAPVPAPAASAAAPAAPAPPSSSRTTTTLECEVDVTALLAAIEAAGSSVAAREDTAITIPAFVVKAVADGLRSVPQLNGGGSTVDLGVVTGSRTIVVAGAESLSVGGVARRLVAEPTAGVAPTFTITGAIEPLARVELPNLTDGASGALGVGAVVRAVRVLTTQDGTEAVAVRSVVRLVLTTATDAVDRAAAGAFLGGLQDRLEDNRTAAVLTR